jgi:hypothetical protein
VCAALLRVFLAGSDENQDLFEPDNWKNILYITPALLYTHAVLDLLSSDVALLSVTCGSATS